MGMVPLVWMREGLQTQISPKKIAIVFFKFVDFWRSN